MRGKRTLVDVHFEDLALRQHLLALAVHTPVLLVHHLTLSVARAALHLYLLHHARPELPQLDLITARKR